MKEGNHSSSTSKMTRTNTRNDTPEQHASKASPTLVRDNDYISLSDSAVTVSCHPSNFFGSHRGFFICAVCDGLVVEYDILHNYITVRNPATCEVLHLPLPPAKLICKSERRYESLKIGEEKMRPLLEQEYLRRLMVSRDQKKLFLIYNVHTRPDLDIHVGLFDISTGCSVIIKNFPRGVFSDLSKLIPMWWNNCLAVADLTEKNLQVLVLEEKVKRKKKYYKWSEKKAIVSSGFLQHLITKGLLIPVEIISDNDLWYHSNGKHKLCYDIKQGKIKETRVWDTIKTFEYRPSLRRLEGMMPFGPGYVKLVELQGIQFSFSNTKARMSINSLGSYQVWIQLEFPFSDD